MDAAPIGRGRWALAALPLVLSLAGSPALGHAFGSFVDANQQAIVDEVVDLLRLPNDAANVADIERNAQELVELAESHGFSAQVLRYEDTPPAVFAQRTFPGAEKTVTFYMHFDGQPTDPARWTTPPFEPVLREGTIESGGQIIPMEAPFDDDARIYARSASDDKSPIVAILWAVRALEDAGITPKVNINLFLEGEEEAGSLNLEAMLRKHQGLLQSDLWIMGDGPIETDGRNRAIFGVRGVRSMQLTVFGPERALHSGHFGNVAPDAAGRLAHIIASMRAEDGTITMEGFYDGIPAPGQQALSLARLNSSSDRALYDDIGVAVPERPDRAYGEAILYPSMTILGIQGGSTGALAKNIIEPKATASIGFRMVPGQDLERLKRVVADHLQARGYHLIDREPTKDDRLAHARLARVEWSEAGYGAVWTPVDSAAAKAALSAVRAYTGDRLAIIPSLGGSLPLEPIVDVLNPPLIIVPIVNPDNNQHAPDENVRLGHLFDGIELYATMLAELDLSDQTN